MNILVSAVLGFVAASVGVPLVKRVLGRFYPVSKISLAPQRDPSTAETALLENLRRNYDRVVAVTAVIFSLLFWLLLVVVARNVRTFPDATFLFVFAPYTLGAPAMGLGLVTAGLVVEAEFRRRLAARYDEFVQYRDALSRVNTRKVARPLYAGVATLAIAAAILMVDDYAYFTPTDIVTNGFWSLAEHRHRYSDVKSIETAPSFIAPNRHRVDRREYVFRFRDGSSWCTLSSPATSSAETRAQLAQFVSSRSTGTIEEKETLTRDDL